jgi:sugar phosphate isomerase/epimerase
MPLNRREFVATALGAAAATGLAACARHAAGASTPAAPTPARLPLGFSTLGTPDWSWDRILRRATTDGYVALELRGYANVMDVTTLPEFAPARRAATRAQLADLGLRIGCLSAGTTLHERDVAKRAAGMDEARRFIDLAQAMGVPYVRVFGDKYQPNESREATRARIAEGLHTLGGYAGDRGVMVLMETHGDIVDSPSLLDVMQRAESRHVGLVWDAHHTFVDGKEAPADTFARIGRYVHHTHLKDSLPGANGDRHYVLLGRGEVPVREQARVLMQHGYRGLLSFEWEKKWHPDIDDPDVAIPHYAATMREYLAGIGG